MRGAFGGMVGAVWSRDSSGKPLARSSWTFLALGMLGLFLVVTAVLVWLGETGGGR